MCVCVSVFVCLFGLFVFVGVYWALFSAVHGSLLWCTRTVYHVRVGECTLNTSPTMGMYKHENYHVWATPDSTSYWIDLGLLTW